MRSRGKRRGVRLCVAVAVVIGVAVAACSTSEGEDRSSLDAAAEIGSDTTTAEAGGLDTVDVEDKGDEAVGDGSTDDTTNADQADDDSSSTPETLASVSIEDSGCVTCHTDKDAMIALAPTEEVQEASGGG